MDVSPLEPAGAVSIVEREQGDLPRGEQSTPQRSFMLSEGSVVQSADYVLDPTDVLAHVFFAEGSTDRVSLVTEMGELTGRFRLPEDGGLEFVHGNAYVPLERGSPVYADYDGPGPQYRFYTSVIAVGHGVIRLHLPDAIDRTERRLAARIVLGRNDGVEFRALGVNASVPCVAVDLSDGGVSWLDTTGWNLQEGQIVYGELILGSTAALSIGVEVRHAQEADGGRVTGGPFANISLADRAALSRFLMGLLRNN